MRRLTKPYTTVRLLALGPLTRAEFAEITGWNRHTVDETLRLMAKAGRVERFFVPGSHRFVYRLPSARAHAHFAGGAR